MKIIAKRSKENGVAIILALIFLTIFMILAFAFTARALSAGRSATYQMAELHSQAMCDSALKEIMSIIQQYDSGSLSPFPEKTWSKITIKESTSANFIDCLGITPSSVGTLAFAPSTDINVDMFNLTGAAPNGHGVAQWTELKTNTVSPGDGTRTNILYSWYAISLTGLIDPNYSAESSGRDLTTDYRRGLTHTDDTADKFAHELPVVATGYSTVASTTSATSYWKSITEICSKQNTPLVKSPLYPHGQLELIPIKETVGLLDLNTIKDMPDLNTSTKLYDNIISKIPYLKNAYNAAGATEDDKYVIKQIAACLKDYCDTDSYPTTNFWPKDASHASAECDGVAINAADRPYCGVENSPRISELGVTSIYATTGTAPNIQPVIYLRYEVELTQPRSKAYPDSASVVDSTVLGPYLLLDGSVSYKYNANASTMTVPYSAKIQYLNTQTQPFIYYKTGATGASPDCANVTGSDKFSGSTIVVHDKLTLNNFCLLDSSKTHVLDFVNCNYNNVKDVSAVIFDASLNPDDKTFMFATYDVLQNKDLISDFVYDVGAQGVSKWKGWCSGGQGTAGSNGLWTSTKKHTLGVGVNNDDLLGDVQSGTDQTLFPNFGYCRNSSPKSLGELGLIPRGQKYRTLNLCEFNETTPNQLQFKKYKNTQTSVNAASDGGDSSILDQVHLGVSDPDIKPAALFSAVNVNGSDAAPLSALFSNIGIETTPSTVIVNTKLSSLINQFAWKTAANYINFEGMAQKRNNINTRHPLRYGWYFTRDSLADDNVVDREREELYWKTKNLVNINSTYFQIVVSVASGYNLTTASKKDGSAKIVATVRRNWDPSTNKFSYSILSREYTY